MEVRIASASDMDKVYALRNEVFVIEQNVPPEIEIDEEDKHATHIIAEENGEVVFLGEIDSIVSERSATAQTMKISARSLAALLLDNEAEPLDYNSPSPQLIFRRH